MMAQVTTEGQRRKRAAQRIAFTLLTLSTVSAFIALGAILYSMIANGASALSWHFLVEFPRKMMTEGGIYPALVGSFYLTVGAVLLSLPFAVASAIWLSEYSRGGLWVRVIRVGVNSLAGVPSIVFGMLGLTLFVKVLGLGVSLLAGALTLALLILPILIRAGEEALQAVPMSFREGALALGATKWHAVRTVVLPSAIPGILTGLILGVSRAIGETAPIMFTAAAFYMSRLPETLSDKVMALPYHIFVMATESPNYFRTRNLQFGAALVLLGMVMVMNLGAVMWRARVRRRKQW
jgi:phosphate transport system permease protein